MAYGWWSDEMAEKFGYCIYRTPENHQVLVTCVSRSPTDPGVYWRDVYFVGIVTDWVVNVPGAVHRQVAERLRPEAIPIPFEYIRTPPILNPRYKKVYVDVEL